MTATQVFLRFIKEECREKDGSVNIAKAKAWRRELRRNNISTITITIWPHKCIRRSKNYVDDYLSRVECTLGGFMSHFMEHRYTNFAWIYGRERELTATLRKKWRIFLSQHIDGEINKYWIKGRTFEYAWKN